MEPKKRRDLPWQRSRQAGWRSALLLLAIAALHCDGEPSGEPSIAAEQLALSPSNPQVAQGTAQQFTVRSFLPSGQLRDRTRQVKWSVAREGAGALRLPFDGLLPAAEPGRYTVTAQYGDRALSTVITITSATLTALAVSPSLPKIAKGLAQSFTAKASFSDGTTQDVTALSAWSVKDVLGSGVAVITSLGIATGKNVGKARVSVRYLTKTTTTTLEVTAAKLTMLTVGPASPTIAKGSAQAFSASGLFSDGSVRDMTADVDWAIADVTGSGVASIDGAGGAVGLQVGAALVSAAYDGQLAETTLTVTAATVVSLAVTPSAVTLAKGTTQPLTATATFSDASTQVVTMTAAWTATDLSGSGVASVDSTGLAKGNAAGTARITCTYRGQTGSVILIVTPAVLTRLDVTPASATIAKGLTQLFTAIGTYSDGSTQVVSSLATWTTADVTGMDVASVSGAGLASGKNPGTATVTATYQKKVSAASLTVSTATLSALAIDPLKPDLNTGATQQFHATGTLSDGSTQDVTSLVSWSVADVAPASGVAAVSTSGLVTGKAEGQATVTAQLFGWTAATVLTVRDGLCTTGAYRCGPASSVEICNSGGTGWLYSTTCASACAAGLCTGSCTAGERRCNLRRVEECSTDGTRWTTVESCAGTCSSGTCALLNLDVTTSRYLEGELFVDGDFIVRAGATVLSASGELTVHARNITVENLGSISSTAKGNPAGSGAGSVPSSLDGSGGGGGYGTVGTNGYNSAGGSVIHTNTDSEVQGGGNGAAGYPGYGGAGGLGGGTIRLIARSKISIAGKVTADGTSGADYVRTDGGGGGGGAGGGVLLAAVTEVAVTGTISVAGGSGGSGYAGASNKGGAGGLGRVRILAGTARKVTGAIIGQSTSSILPPLVITSSSHPDPSLIYNDNSEVKLTWDSPFPERQGYYQLLNTSSYTVPTPASGRFTNAEKVSYPASAVSAGANYFHIVSVDAVSSLGSVGSNFRLQINTKAPTLGSASHPSESSWYVSPDVFVSWSFPVAEENVKGIYYVLDHYGDTVPTPADTWVPLPQKVLLRAGLTPDIWVLHAVAADQRGYLTKAAAHYRLQIGSDPGLAIMYGRVNDSLGASVGATVSLNRGLWSTTTDSAGSYRLPAVTAGTYELRTTKPGYAPVVQTITLTKGSSSMVNVTLL